MAFFVFLNKNRKLRNRWWVTVFFLVLAAITFPFILLSQQGGNLRKIATTDYYWSLLTDFSFFNTAVKQNIGSNIHSTDNKLHSS
jgi:hypothetical protein